MTSYLWLSFFSYTVFSQYLKKWVTDSLLFLIVWESCVVVTQKTRECKGSRTGDECIFSVFYAHQKLEKRQKKRQEGSQQENLCEKSRFWVSICLLVLHTYSCRRVFILVFMIFVMMMVVWLQESFLMIQEDIQSYSGRCLLKKTIEKDYSSLRTFEFSTETMKRVGGNEGQAAGFSLNR